MIMKTKPQASAIFFYHTSLLFPNQILDSHLCDRDASTDYSNILFIDYFMYKHWVYTIVNQAAIINFSHTDENSYPSPTFSWSARSLRCIAATKDIIRGSSGSYTTRCIKILLEGTVAHSQPAVQKYYHRQRVQRLIHNLLYRSIIIRGYSYSCSYTTHCIDISIQSLEGTVAHTKPFVYKCFNIIIYEVTIP